VVLYQKSLGKYKKAQGSWFGCEAHFTIPTDSKFETGYLSKGAQEPSTNEPTLTTEDYMDTNNIMVEYASNDMFGYLL
jgi:hypothetical protein